jgi:hypothetical protein
MNFKTFINNKKSILENVQVPRTLTIAQYPMVDITYKGVKYHVEARTLFEIHFHFTISEDEIPKSWDDIEIDDVGIQNLGGTNDISHEESDDYAVNNFTIYPYIDPSDREQRIKRRMYGILNKHGSPETEELKTYFKQVIPSGTYAKNNLGITEIDAKNIKHIFVGKLLNAIKNKKLLQFDDSETELFKSSLNNNILGFMIQMWKNGTTQYNHIPQR